MAWIPRQQQPYSNMTPAVSYDWTKQKTNVPSGKSKSKEARSDLAMKGLRGAAVPR